MTPSHGSRPPDVDERRLFVADPAALAELELTVADLTDPDLRSVVIAHEHPEFEQALREGTDVRIGGEEINPRVHLAIHEIVATQLWDDDPPEVWETAKRLLGLGYERHEILHMLATPVAEHVWGALREDRAYDPEHHRAALRALPGSREKQRSAGDPPRRHVDARKDARRAARAARRRNRRPN